MNTFGQRIKAFRGELHISQSNLAKTCGVSSAAVCQWQGDKNEPSQSAKRIICSHYHVNRDWLDSGQGDMLVRVQDSDTTTVLQALENGSAVKRELLLIISELPDDMLDAVLDRLIAKRKG